MWVFLGFLVSGGGEGLIVGLFLFVYSLFRCCFSGYCSFLGVVVRFLFYFVLLSFCLFVFY